MTDTLYPRNFSFFENSDSVIEPITETPGETGDIDEFIATIKSFLSGMEDLEDVHILDETIDINEESADITDELRAISKIGKEISTIVGQEGLFEKFGELLGILGSLGKKLVPFVKGTYRFSRNRLMASFLHLQTISKIVEKRIRKNLHKVNNETLSDFELEAFPYSVWIDAAKVSLDIFNFMQNINSVVFSPSTDIETREIKDIRERLDTLGIKMVVSRNHIDYNSLLDTRSYENVNGLGFTKSQLPNTFRYLSEMSRRVKNGKENALEPLFNSVMKEIANRASKHASRIEKKEITKGTEEYQKEAEKIINAIVRYDFFLCTMRCCYYLFDVLSKDALRVCETYEKAIGKQNLPTD